MNVYVCSRSERALAEIDKLAFLSAIKHDFQLNKSCSAYAQRHKARLSTSFSSYIFLFLFIYIYRFDFSSFSFFFINQQLQYI
jgi:hypothetical protein